MLRPLRLTTRTRMIENEFKGGPRGPQPDVARLEHLLNSILDHD